jgi:thiol-disulfide isomerase/thioredoxin
MRQLLFAVGLLAVACGVGYTDEDKKEEKKEVGFVELRKEFLDKFRGAKSEDDRKAALKQYGPKFLVVAEKGGKDAFGATMFAVQIGSMGEIAEVKSKALALLKKDHLASPELGGALPTLAQALGKDAKPLFKELMEKGANDKIKAMACSSLLEALENQLTSAKGEELEKVKKEMAEYRKIGVEKYKMKDLFVGAKMADLKSEDLDGKAVKLSDHKGKVVVLDIWATWCPPCRAMIPHERELVKKLKDKPFVLVSVSFDEEKKTLTDFLEKEKMPWVHWFNGKTGEIGEQLNVRFFPTIFVLDGKGVIRFKGVRGPAMDKAVETLLKEMEDEKKSSE